MVGIEQRTSTMIMQRQGNPSPEDYIYGGEIPPDVATLLGLQKEVENRKATLSPKVYAEESRRVSLAYWRQSPGEARTGRQVLLARSYDELPAEARTVFGSTDAADNVVALRALQSIYQQRSQLSNGIEAWLQDQEAARRQRVARALSYRAPSRLQPYVRSGRHRPHDVSSIATVARRSPVSLAPSAPKTLVYRRPEPPVKRSGRFLLRIGQAVKAAARLFAIPVTATPEPANDLMIEAMKRGGRY